MSNPPPLDALHTHRTLNYLRVQAERQCSALMRSSTLRFLLGINNEALHSRHTQCEHADQREKKVNDNIKQVLYGASEANTASFSLFIRL